MILEREDNYMGRHYLVDDYLRILHLVEDKFPIKSEFI